MKINDKYFISTPLIFLYSFIRPKEYVKQLMDSDSKLPIYITLAGLLILSVVIPFIDISKAFLSKGLFVFFLKFSIYAALLISQLAYMFFYTYFLQNSFIKHELKELRKTGKLEDEYWHKRVGFFHVFLTHSTYIVIQTIIIYLVGTLNLQSSIISSNRLYYATFITLLSFYSLYVHLQTLKYLFYKKTFLETFFWSFSKGIMAVICTLISLGGILAIPYFLFKLRKLINFYPLEVVEKKSNLKRNLIVFASSLATVFVGLFVYLAIEVHREKDDLPIKRERVFEIGDSENKSVTADGRVLSVRDLKEVLTFIGFLDKSELGKGYTQITEDAWTKFKFATNPLKYLELQVGNLLGVKYVKNFNSIEELKAKNPNASKEGLKYVFEVQKRYYETWERELSKNVELDRIADEFPHSSTTVVLNWRIDSMGNLINDSANIKKSSGSEPMDQYFLVVLEKASPFPVPPKKLLEKSNNEVNIDLEFAHNVFKKTKLGKVVKVQDTNLIKDD